MLLKVMDAKHKNCMEVSRVGPGLLDQGLGGERVMDSEKFETHRVLKQQKCSHSISMKYRRVGEVRCKQKEYARQREQPVQRS